MCLCITVEESMRGCIYGVPYGCLTPCGFSINSDFEFFGKGTKCYLRTHTILT